MQPKDILMLLEIIDLSSQSPLYGHITSAAHEALVEAQLHIISRSHDDDEEENHSSPPQRAPSVPRRT